MKIFIRVFNNNLNNAMFVFCNRENIASLKHYTWRCTKGKEETGNPKTRQTLKGQSDLITELSVLQMKHSAFLLIDKADLWKCAVCLTPRWLLNSSHNDVCLPFSWFINTMRCPSTLEPQLIKPAIKWCKVWKNDWKTGMCHCR